MPPHSYCTGNKAKLWAVSLDATCRTDNLRNAMTGTSYATLSPQLCMGFIVKIFKANNIEQLRYCIAHIFPLPYVYFSTHE